MGRHYNIPIFIPEAACPHQCIFCNQRNITEKASQPSVKEVLFLVERHLSTIPDDSEIEIAFFGGNFTGLPVPLQEQYLSAVQPYLSDGRVSGIRCSTRPDYIHEESVGLLSYYKVRMVELGAQSFDQEVLQKSGRGHTVEDIYTAVATLQRLGMPFGLQMMTGLPGDTPEKSLHTAREIIRLQADNTRVYPCLVIRNTQLEQLFLKGKYQPQSMADAVTLCSELVLLFEKSKVKVLRVGLHRSEGFDQGETLVAGPYHPSFKELVESNIWRELLKESINFSHKGHLSLHVPKGTSGLVAGHKAGNREWLEMHFTTISIKEDISLKDRELYVDYC